MGKKDSTINCIRRNFLEYVTPRFNKKIFPFPFSDMHDIIYMELYRENGLLLLEVATEGGVAYGSF